MKPIIKSLTQNIEARIWFQNGFYNLASCVEIARKIAYVGLLNGVMICYHWLTRISWICPYCDDINRDVMLMYHDDVVDWLARICRAHMTLRWHKAKNLDLRFKIIIHLNSWLNGCNFKLFTTTQRQLLIIIYIKKYFYLLSTTINFLWLY